MSYLSISAELSVVNGVLLRGHKIAILVFLRDHVVRLAHEGHQGIVKTKHRLRTKVWWPDIDEQAESFVGTVSIA